MYAIADYTFPPSYYWSFIAGAWFLGQGIVSQVTNQKFPFQFMIAGSFLTVFLFYIIAAGMVGPWLMFLLLLGPIGAVIRVLRRKPDPVSRATKISTLSLACGMSLLLIGSAAWSYKTASKMQPGDYALKWQGTTFHRNLIRNLGNEGISAAPELRRLIREGNDHTVDLAGCALANVTDNRDADMRLLIDAYRPLYEDYLEFEKTYGSSFGLLSETALERMSGIDMPEKSSPEEWEHAWSRKLAADSQD
jgi:hypothetical protein